MTRPTPKIEYLRRRKLRRTEHSRRFLAWLNAQDVRLTTFTLAQVYALLRSTNARAVERQV
jgi:hypothetical protein